MPYSNISQLPSSIKKVLPKHGQSMFMKIINQQLKKGSKESLAFQVAWGVIKKRFKKVKGKWVANDSDFVMPELYELRLQPNESELIINEVDGELVIDAVLASTYPFKNDKGEKRVWTEEALVEMANQINLEGSTNPIFTHEELGKAFVKHGGNIEMVANELKKNRGLIKSIKAVVEKGKLWIRAMLDKRYRNHVKQFKGVSIEAFSTPVNSLLTKPKYLGFIFTNHPRDKLATVA